MSLIRLFDDSSVDDDVYGPYASSNSFSHIPLCVHSAYSGGKEWNEKKEIYSKATE
jgi:hypothetical protein